NLRIIGLPEGIEGSHPTKFISDSCVELFGSEMLVSPPELDQAHLSLAPKPDPLQRPRPMIIRFHRYQTKELVLRAAREWGSLVFRRHRIFNFPDLSADVTPSHAAFKDIKARLYKHGIKFSLLYPTTLHVTFKGQNLIFTSLQEAEAFYKNQVLQSSPWM
ncbi:LINE-1 type transposase domain-containing protein 1, partial [Huso huso]